MILIVNTANADYIEIITTEGGSDSKIVRVDGKYKQSEQLLTTIDGILKDDNKQLVDIAGIVVVSGPGGFTALRIGVVIANTLAYALKIPAVGVTLDEFSDNSELITLAVAKLSTAKVGGIVMPEYGKEPNIN